MRPTRPLVRAVVLCAVAAIPLASCGGGSTPSTAANASTPAGQDASGDVLVSGADQPASTTTGDDVASSAPSPAPGPVTTVAVPAALASLPTVELLAPAGAGVGASPVFEWAPVDGAVEYRLGVTTGGVTVWSWQGPGTSVRFGGYETEPPAGFAGIRFTDPAWWSVVALGDGGRVIAVSPQRAVSPDDRVPTAPVATPGSTPDVTAPAGPASTVAEPSPAPAGVDPTTVDPCTLVSADEAAVALGGAVGEPEPSSGGGGKYRDCTWARLDDQFSEFRVAVNNDPASYDPAGWTTGEIVAVDGVGDESYISTDFGVRIGWLRSGVAVSVVAPVDPATAPTWVEMAALVDARLAGTAPLPA